MQGGALYSLLSLFANGMHSTQSFETRSNMGQYSQTRYKYTISISIDKPSL